MGQNTEVACLVTWFCYHLIAKPGNKTGTPSRPDPYIDGLVQDCSISSALTMKIRQSCTKPTKFIYFIKTPESEEIYEISWSWTTALSCSGSAFIKPDQRNPWIKDQIKITLLPTISHLLLPNFVSCGRACPSHMTQILVTVGAKLWTADRFIVDPWSMDYADPVW